MNRRNFLGLSGASILAKILGRFLPRVNIPSVKEDDEVITYVWHAAVDWTFEGKPTADGKGMHWIGRCPEYPTEVLQWMEYEGSASLLD